MSYLPGKITFLIFSLLITATRDNYGKHIIDLEERYHKEIHLYKSRSGAARNGHSKGLYKVGKLALCQHFWLLRQADS